MSEREEFLERNKVKVDPLNYPFGMDEALLNLEEKEPKEPKVKKTVKKEPERKDNTFPFSADELLLRQELDGVLDPVEEDDLSL